MTREWYSARELAGLPGVPEARKHVSRMATREAWRSRERQGRGGGREFHVKSLPAETQRHLVAQLQAELLRQAAPVQLEDPEAVRERQRRREAAVAKLAGLPESKQQRAYAREWALEAWLYYARRTGQTKRQAARAFGRSLRSGEVEVPDGYAEHLPAKDGLPHLTPATLYRWQAAYRDEHLLGLVANYGNRRGRSKIDETPGMKGVVLGLMSEHPHITGRKVAKYLRAAHPSWPSVAPRTIARWMDRYKRDNAGVWTRHTSPDRWKNEFMPAFGSQSEDVHRLNQRWELDSTPGDWLLADGKRHVILGCIDIYSRRVKLLVSESSKAESVCALLRRALMDWGVPEQIRTDNGKDYVSRQVTTVLQALEVEQLLCLPFESEGKGTIERHFRTMSHGVLDMLPGFAGHNVAERAEIRARQSFADRVMHGADIEVGLTPDELQAVLDQWVDATYMARPQEALGARSPREVVRGWRGEVRTLHDERALDILLSPLEGVRTVTKKGLRLNHLRYGSPELFLHVGERVQVRRDVRDLGRVFVFDVEDGAFLCEAECPEVLGRTHQELAVASKRYADRVTRAGTRELRETRRFIAEDPVAVMLAHDREQARNVVEFPAADEVPYTTRHLEAAGEAARAGDPVEPEPMDERERALHEQLRRECFGEAEAEDDNVERLRDEETPRQRFQRWVLLDRATRRGGALEDDSERFYRLYQRSAEFRVQLAEHLEHGLNVEGRPVDPAGLDDLLPQVGITRRF